ncbi:heavy metal transport/detoxification protein [Treponema primitia ZAS-2]|uniref:Heavy metal transport/detoxification protein n=1 Tax=Treponema primitia (strain ATCC BAA-887 / DSM 12427 / ZAS-2) TaxID=545694 RepID=F5YKQ6_TREPZ|nr:heavy metal transporter [Treponema primitia]AEF84634.1 heavy metal transport/detoxification protein [Treponema primitia ZAS-2]
MKRNIALYGLLMALVLILPGCSRGNSAKSLDFAVKTGVAVPSNRAGQTAGNPVNRIPVAAPAAPYRNPAVIDGAGQSIATTFTSRRYAPITVQAGIPVKWTIKVEPGNLTGCNNAIIIPKFKIRQRLQVGETVVEFTPTETGNIAYSCWMGMIRSVITVVDDLAAESSGSFQPALYRPGEAVLRTAALGPRGDSALEEDEDDFSGFGGSGGCCGAGGFALEGDDPYLDQDDGYAWNQDDFDDPGDALAQNGFGGGCCGGGSRRL